MAWDNLFVSFFLNLTEFLGLKEHDILYYIMSVDLFLLWVNVQIFYSDYFYTQSRLKDLYISKKKNEAEEGLQCLSKMAMAVSNDFSLRHWCPFLLVRFLFPSRSSADNFTSRKEESLSIYLEFSSGR
jgi:hypothetical protein